MAEEAEQGGKTLTIDPKDLLKLDELMKLFDSGAMTVAQMRGITTEEMETVYALAYDYYRTGRYDEAETLFAFLTTFDHFNEKYWMGMGAVLQVKKKFEKAVQVYSYVAAILNLENVKASYYAAECNLAMGRRAHAESAIEHVKHYADVKTETGRTFKAKALRLEKLMKGNSGR